MRILHVVDLIDIAAGDGEATEKPQHISSTQEQASERVDRCGIIKWLMFLSICLLGLASGLNIFTFSTTTSLVTDSVVIWRREDVLSSICFLFYALFGIFIRYGFETIEHKVFLVAIGALQIFGDFSVFIGFSLTEPSKAMAMIVLGHVLNAAGFSCSLELSSHLQSIWVGKGRKLINTAYFASVLLGVSIKYAISALLIGDHSVAELSKALVLLKVSTVALTFVIGISTFCMKAKTHRHHLSDSTPPSNPRKRSTIAIECPCVNINSTLATQGYAVYFALLPPMFTCLQRVPAIAPSQAKSSLLWIESLLALSAVVGILCGAALMLCKSNLKLVGTFTSFFSAVFMLLFTYSLTHLKSMNLSIVFVIAWGFTAAMWLALGIKYVASITDTSLARAKYTESLVCGSLFTVILIYFNGWVMTVYGFEFVGYFVSTLYVLSFVLITASRGLPR